MNLDYGEDRWWWLVSDDEKADKLFAEVDRISEETIDAQSVIEASACTVTLPTSLATRALIVLPASRRISHNVIATATDALVAEVTQKRQADGCYYRGRLHRPLGQGSSRSIGMPSFEASVYELDAKLFVTLSFRSWYSARLSR